MPENDNIANQQIEKLRKRIEILEHALASTDVHFTVHDRQGRYLYVNPPGLAGQNLRLEDVEGKSWRELGFPKELGIQFDKQVERVFTEAVTIRNETEFPTIKGPRIFENVFQPAYNNSGTVVALVATRMDITEIRETEEALRKSNADLQAQLERNTQLQAELQELAIRDALTGLYNRRYFEEIFQQEILRNKRENRQISLAMIDIDLFKNVNDTYGHRAGDEMLISLSKLLRDNTRADDTICRFGGEEFIILLPGLSRENARDRAETWRGEFEKYQLEYNGQQIKTTISVGIYSFSGSDITLDLAIQKTDDALYQAKEGGRNMVVVSNF